MINHKCRERHEDLIGWQDECSLEEDASSSASVQYLFQNLHLSVLNLNSKVILFTVGNKNTALIPQEDKPREKNEYYVMGRTHSGLDEI